MRPGGAACSQESEYPAVVIPVLTQHYPRLQRNLLYTVLTRGRRLVVLVGQRRAIAIVLRNVSGRRRCTRLLQCLRGPLSSLGTTVGGSRDKGVRQ